MIEFRVLGPFEVVDGDRTFRLGSPQQRALLVVLLMHRDQPVSADTLIDALWGERAPATAVKIVQGYVSNLRRALGDGLLVTRAPGYMLQVAPGQVDADRFESLVDQGRRAFEDGNAREAGVNLNEALALWRGPALADFAYQSFAQTWIHRLEESRIGALEQRIEVELTLGQHARLVPELEAKVREHPLRERFVGQLMLALYRSGRQADALQVYRVARRRMVEELGLEPGGELQQLERSILEHSPTLDAPLESSVPDVQQRTRRRVGGLLIAAGGAILLAALGGLAVALASDPAGLVVSPNTAAVIDPHTDEVTAQIPVGDTPESIAAGGGSIWVANTVDHTLSEIDAASRTVEHTLAPGGTVDGVAAGEGQVWAFESSDWAHAIRIDPTFGAVLSRVKLSQYAGTYPASSTAAAVGDGSAWFADNAAAVVQVGRNGAIRSTTNVGNETSGIAVGDGSVWATDLSSDTVSRIDSGGGVAATIPVGRGASGVAVGDGGVWVADTFDNTVVRINPGTNSVTTTIRVGDAPQGIAWGDGSVWVANGGDGTVSRIDPRTDRVTATIAVGQSPQQLIVTDHRVWVTVQAKPPAIVTGTGEQPGVIRVSRERPFPYLDPTRVGSADQDELQMLYETCAGLLTYRDLPGAAGERLVPDVATALPTVSADGRTYTFTIRKGFRFSPPSGEAVTAETFEHTIDRMLSPGLYGYERGFFGDIVGETAYNAGKAKRLTGVSVHGDQLQVRLTRPAPDLPARLAMISFCAVPDDTPDVPQTQPIASAGPYYIAQSSPEQLILERNPNYGGHRPRVPRVIIYSFGEKYTAAVKQRCRGSQRLREQCSACARHGHPSVGLHTTRAEIWSRQCAGAGGAPTVLQQSHGHPRRVCAQPPSRKPVRVDTRPPGGQLRDRPSGAGRGCRPLLRRRTDKSLPAARGTGIASRSGLSARHTGSGQGPGVGSRHPRQRNHAHLQHVGVHPDRAAREERTSPPWDHLEYHV